MRKSCHHLWVNPCCNIALGISKSSLPNCQSLLSFLLGRLEKKEPHIKFKVYDELVLAHVWQCIYGEGLHSGEGLVLHLALG